MSSFPRHRLTPQQYLTIERQAEWKSEFHDGEMFAMSGGTRQHSLIAGNTITSLNNQLRDRACEVYTSDMRVKVSATGLYTYPDASVVCGRGEFEDERADTLLNPILIVEVLSESSEGYDRGKKFQHYRQLRSLVDYWPIAQDSPHVEVHTRQADGRWVLWETDDLAAVVHLQSIDCSVPLTDIYARLFDERESGGS